MKTPSDLYELVEPYLDQWNVWFNIGPENDSDDQLIVFDCWGDLYAVYGLINGFTEQLKDKPYFYNKTIQEHLAELQAQYRGLSPDASLGEKSRVERQIDATLQWIRFEKHLEGREEVLNFDDFELEAVFSDEYSVCACCGHVIVRTSPDSYCWTPPLFLEGEGYICDKCAPEYAEEVLEDYSNVERSIPDQFDTEDLGLVQINEESFQNGLYGGQLDEPGPIIEALNSQDIDVWFKVYPRQFDMDFDVYVREADESKAKAILEGVDTEADIDPAVACQQALKAASQQMSQLSGDGIKVATCNADGTADVRMVSPEDFVKNGIK